MTSISQRFSLPRDRRHLLALLALLLGVAEFADAFFVSFWIGAAVFAVLFAAGAAWTRRGGWGGPVLVGVLCVFELQSFPTWERSGVGEWIHQLAFVAVTAACLVVAVLVLKGSFTSRQARVASSEA